MGRLRRFYYDVFSNFYDLIIDLHSSDRSAALRQFLVASSEIKPGDQVLDICTGTGSVAMLAGKAVEGLGGQVVALDFSHGMLKKAQRKKVEKRRKNVHLVQADVSRMPFADDRFDCVTCSHAMYELTETARKKGLAEIRRVLKNHGSFVMMEHEIPEKPIVRFLYYVRLTTMGSRKNRGFATDERAELRSYFSDVIKIPSPTGRSKLLSAKKERAGARSPK